jgi:GH15 family glucan-1,4-alpha-glucosidase
VSGLRSVDYLTDVPQQMIQKGLLAIDELGTNETFSRTEDMAQLSLIYPHRIYTRNAAYQVLEKIEKRLLRRNGVIRYEGDSYYSTREKEGRHHPPSFYYGTEAEWCLGLPWLALCYLELGEFSKAAYFVERTEEVMLPDGSLPELYYSGTDEPNPNTPLGWANALYVVAKERLR